MNFNIFTLLFFCNFPFLCNRWMPFKAFTTDLEHFDFIIVGGGATGSVLASRLSENPKIKVLLLEAGSCPPFGSEIPALVAKLPQTEYDWSYKAVPQKDACFAFPNHQPSYPLGKVLGGSTTINGMTYLRGNKNDYEQWKKMGLDGWSYDDVLPYFLISEGMTVKEYAADKTYHNTSGPLTLSNAAAESKAVNALFKAAQAAGYPTIDLNAAKQTGFMRNVFTMRDGSRCSNAKAYLIPAQFRSNLKIFCNSRVTKILFNNNKEAYGVNFQQGLFPFTAKASKEVVLSAGSIHSPQLLMLSGVGPQDQLNKFKIPMVANRPGVGENFQDHYGSISLYWKVNCSECAFSELDFYNPINILQWLIFRTGPLTIPFGVEAVGYVNSKYADKSIDWPDVQFQMVTVLPVDDIVNIYGVSKELLSKYMEPIKNSRKFAILPFIMRPKSRGNIKIQSNDPKIAPLIDLKYYNDPEDMKTILQGIRIALDFGNSDAFKAIGAEFNPQKFPGCESHSFLSDEYLECLARHMTFTDFHPVGTCKMGLESDPSAVVDNNLNVFGVKNLRVVDASIMPTIISANAVAATIMIGEKGSAIIRAKYSI